jgi:class 3 adenylate cyclase
VVTGEVASVKKEIVFLRDTVNAKARIQEACRTLGERMPISADLARRLPLPAGCRLRSLGAAHLRGKESEVERCALDTTARGRGAS